jgi:methylmalonyl-CoA decarboxylase
MPYITASIDDRVGTIVLDRPAKRNALSEELVEEALTALAAFEPAGVRAVILRAAPGSRIWSAGHDIAELPAGRRDPLAWDDSLRRLVRGISAFPGPVIALVEGSVWGGACELVFACDVVVAATDASFAFTPAKMGVPYDLSGMLGLVSAASVHVLKEMLFTAQPLSALRAERLGIVNYALPAAELEECVRTLTQHILANAPLSIAVMKEEVRILCGARPVAPEGYARIQGMRRVVYDSADYGEGIAAVRERRPPVFTGR